MALVGANADQLDQLAGQLESEAHALEQLHRALGRQLHTTPWRGASADRFRQRWTTVHAGQVTQAAEFLRTGSRSLHENARQQRDASGDVGGSSGWTASTAVATSPNDVLPEWWEDAKRILDAIGMPIGKMQEILAVLEHFDPGLRNALLDLLGGSAFMDFLDLAGDALGMADMAIDFVEAFASHSDLPLDEALVYSFAVVGVGFAADKGIGFVSEKLGAVIGSAVFPGAGTAAGFVVGKAVGLALNAGYDALDDKFNLTENAAELMLEGYRDAKAGLAQAGEIAQVVGEHVGEVVDGAVNIAGEVVGGAVGVAGDVAEGAANLAEDALSGITGWFK